MCVQTKLQFQAVLAQVFPVYKGVFGAMYSNVSLRFLNEFPTSYSILRTDEETLNAKIKELLSSRRGRSEEWINERVKRLLEAAKQNPFEQTMYSSHLINLNVLITLILQYQEHLAELELNIDALAEEIEEYDLIQSIPGIGHKIAATILSEIGEIDRLDHPKNWSPLQASTRVSSLQVSSQQLEIESPNVDPGSFDMPWLWLSSADLFVPAIRG